MEGSGKRDYIAANQMHNQGLNNKKFPFYVLSEESWQEGVAHEEAPQKIVKETNRKIYRHERQNRFLLKKSEDYDVFDNVFDTPTIMVINSMINDGLIKSFKSHFASGKESKIYFAIRNDGTPVAIKIYLTVSAEFKKRLRYIAGDPAFNSIKKGSRSMMAAWAKKEFRNLKTAYQNKVRVPAPIDVRKNVLVMEFIGDKEGNAYPTLVNSDVSAEDYKQIIDQVTRLYQRAELVHADLSEYNIMKSDDGIMLFDFGSAVNINHPNAKQFLLRDILNINRFFEKRGVTVLDAGLIVDKIRSEKI
jgi:RIO kinase 1